jgi:hypothetical protein
MASLDAACWASTVVQNANCKAAINARRRKYPAADLESGTGLRFELDSAGRLARIIECPYCLRRGGLHPSGGLLPLYKNSSSSSEKHVEYMTGTQRQT